MATMVTPDAPVRAVKTAQATKSHDGQTGGHPTEQRAGEIHEPFRCLRRHHEVAGEGEERQCHQQRRVGDAVQLDGHHGQVDTRRIEAEHRRRHHDGEQRCTEDGQ